VGHGKRAGSQKRELERRYGWRSTCGGGSWQEVARNGWKWRAVAQQQRSRGAEEMPEEEGEGRGPRGLVGNCKNFKDLTENRIFPLIQSPNEEKVKIEVVELSNSITLL
jgi:hypothetical protein